MKKVVSIIGMSLFPKFVHYSAAGAAFASTANKVISAEHVIAWLEYN